MSRIAIGLCLAILAAGCKNNSDQVAYQQTNNFKPIVAVVPLINNAKTNLSWNVGEELTTSLRFRLIQKDKLYLVDDKTVVAKTKKLSESNDPFGLDMSWMKKTFYNDEFVVFMELMEHVELATSPQKGPSTTASSTELNMTVRIKVVDLRGTEPKIVLQEMVHNTHFIPRQFSDGGEHAPWGSEVFSISPLGIAHAELTKEVATRIEDYILMSTSR